MGGQNLHYKKHKMESTSGFTLLEILITISIFAIIITTVFGSFRTIFSTADIIDTTTTDYEMVKNCLRRMTTDLKSIFVAQYPDYAPPEPFAPVEFKISDPFKIVGDTYSEGNRDFGRLRFTSFAYLPFQNDFKDGISEITYYVQAVGDENYVLRRSSRLNPDKEKSFESKVIDPILCERVQSLSFQYYDSEGEEFDYWDSDDKEFDHTTPRTIGIRIELGEALGPIYFETKIALPVYREKMK